MKRFTEGSVKNKSMLSDFKKLVIMVLPPQHDDGWLDCDLPKPERAILDTVLHCMQVVRLLNTAVALPPIVEIHFIETAMDPIDEEKRWWWCDSSDNSSSHVHQFLERAMLPFHRLEHEWRGVEVLDVKIPSAARGCHQCWSWHNHESSRVQNLPSFETSASPDWGSLPIRFIQRPTRDDDRKARGLEPLLEFEAETEEQAEFLLKSDLAEEAAEEERELRFRVFEAIAVTDGIQYAFGNGEPCPPEYARLALDQIRLFYDTTPGQFDTFSPSMVKHMNKLFKAFARLRWCYDRVAAGEYDGQSALEDELIPGTMRLKSKAWFATSEVARELLKEYEVLIELEDFMDDEEEEEDADEAQDRAQDLWSFGVEEAVASLPGRDTWEGPNEEYPWTSLGSE